MSITAIKQYGNGKNYSAVGEGRITLETTPTPKKYTMEERRSRMDLLHERFQNLFDEFGIAGCATIEDAEYNSIVLCDCTNSPIQGAGHAQFLLSHMNRHMRNLTNDRPTTTGFNVVGGEGESPEKIREILRRALKPSEEVDPPMPYMQKKPREC